MLNKSQIKKSFSNHASQYDETSQLQQEIANKLVEQISIDNPQRTLDIGCGTGYLTGLIQNKFPNSQLSALDCAEGMLDQAKAKHSNILFSQGDAESLPYPDQSFNLVASSTTYQWITNLNQAFLEVNRVLKGDGQFVFSLFAGQTLCELREAYSKVFNEVYPDQIIPLHPFISMAQLIKELELFQTISIQKEIITSFVPSLKSLLRLIKSWGAQNAQKNRLAGLGNRRLLQLTGANYKRLALEKGELPVTWEILYAKVRKKS